jgi:hypothetical protein
MRPLVFGMLIWILWTSYGEAPQTGPLLVRDWQPGDAFASRKACEDVLEQHGFKRDDPQGWVSIYRYDNGGYNIRDYPALPLYDFVRARCLPDTKRP